MTSFSRIACLAAVATLAAPAVAAAQPYGYSSPEYQRGYNPNGYEVQNRNARAYRDDYAARCRHDRRSDGNKGTVAGALVGGASGALIGGNLVGGLVGAGVGAVAGHAIAKSRDHC